MGVAHPFEICLMIPHLEDVRVGGAGRFAEEACIGQLPHRVFVDSEAMGRNQSLAGQASSQPTSPAWSGTGSRLSSY